MKLLRNLDCSTTITKRMIKLFFKNNLKTIVAVALFLLVALIYFYPVFGDNTLKMSDISNWKGMAKELNDYRDVNNEEAVWTNSSFSGMPGYQISVQYLNPVKNVYNAVVGFLSFPVSALFFSLLCFFIMCRTFKVGFYVSFIGALAYGFSTYNFLIMEAGHSSKMMAIAFIPGVIAGLIMAYRHKNWIFAFVVLALFFSLELLVNHIQMTYYFSSVLIVIGIAEFLRLAKAKEYKFFATRTLVVMGALVVALLSNFGNYYNTYEFAKQTMRGKSMITVQPNGEQISAAEQTTGLDPEYIVQWCYGKEETLNLLIPTAKGDSRNLTAEVLDRLRAEDPVSYNYVVTQYQENKGKIFGGHWGDQPFTGGPNYIGAIVVFLALLYLIFVNSTLKWSLLVITILTILLSWGKNLGGSVDDMWLTNFFLEYVPLYSKFRAVSSILVVVNLIFPLMAVLFLKHITDHSDWARKKLVTLTATGGAIIILMIIGTTVNGNWIGFLSNIEESKLLELNEAYYKTQQGQNPTAAFEKVTEIRQAVFAEDAWRSIGFILCGFLLLLASIWRPKYTTYTTVGIGLFLLVDLVTVDKRYLNNDSAPSNRKESHFIDREGKHQKYIAWEKNKNYKYAFDATNGDLAIFQIETDTINQPATQQKRAIINAFDKSLKEFKKDHKGRPKSQDQESLMFSSLNLNTNYKVMDLDNPFNSARVSYFHKSSGGYSPAKLGRYQDMIDFYISNELQYLGSNELEKTKVLNMLNTKYYLYQGELAILNRFAYGNAWFVKNVKWVENNNEEILAIDNTNVLETAIIHNEFNQAVTGNYELDSTASIQMNSYSPNHIRYSSESKTKQLAVFSEIYYPGEWQVYIDEKPVPYVRANYILRALEIPEGKHTIDFKFEARALYFANNINLLGFLLLLTGFVLLIVRIIKRSKEEPSANKK